MVPTKKSAQFIFTIGSYKKKVAKSNFAILEWNHKNKFQKNSFPEGTDFITLNKANKLMNERGFYILFQKNDAWAKDS